jgi:hypothetical protein
MKQLTAHIYHPVSKWTQTQTFVYNVEQPDMFYVGIGLMSRVNYKWDKPTLLAQSVIDSRVPPVKVTIHKCIEVTQ